MKRSYVQIDGVLYEKGTEPGRTVVSNGPFIIPDITPFVSPIDRTVVNSRSGIRDHCDRYGVVQTDELKGMKPPDVKPDSKAIRQEILKVINQRGYSEYDK